MMRVRYIYAWKCCYSNLFLIKIVPWVCTSDTYFRVFLARLDVGFPYFGVAFYLAGYATAGIQVDRQQLDGILVEFWLLQYDIH